MVTKAASLRPQQHFARLLITPLRSPNPVKPIDPISLIQLCSKTLAEWFGAAGGNVTGSEIDVVLVEATEEKDGKDVGRREAVIRFPSRGTPAILTALPISQSSYDGQAYRIVILADSGDLAALAGTAGRGTAGYRNWAAQVRAG